MNIYSIFIAIAVQILSIIEAVFDIWMNVPQNATGPMDTNITLTATGTAFVENMATSFNSIVAQINQIL